ncbi:MAG: DEAD/DEAH box helicase [Rivularia sp. (in: cyanobacteria)]
MAEEAKDKNESQQENKSEKVDNRLPYEPPKLRKHGKIHGATKTIIAPGPPFDSAFGFPYFDFS